MVCLCARSTRSKTLAQQLRHVADCASPGTLPQPAPLEYRSCSQAGGCYTLHMMRVWWGSWACGVLLGARWGRRQPLACFASCLHPAWPYRLTRPHGAAIPNAHGSSMGSRSSAGFRLHLYYPAAPLPSARALALSEASAAGSGPIIVYLGSNSEGKVRGSEWPRGRPMGRPLPTSTPLRTPRPCCMLDRFGLWWMRTGTAPQTGL